MPECNVTNSSDRIEWIGEDSAFVYQRDGAPFAIFGLTFQGYVEAESEARTLGYALGERADFLGFPFSAILINIGGAGASSLPLIR